MPFAGSWVLLVREGTVVEVDVADEVVVDEREPNTAATTPSTTMTATTPAISRWRRRVAARRASAACCALWREASLWRRFDVRAMAA
jgi:hypothetical protein